MMPMAQDDGLEQMYQEVILEASKHPSGRVAFAPDLTDEAVSAGAVSYTHLTLPTTSRV